MAGLVEINSVFLEKKVFKILLFHNYLLLGEALHLNKFEIGQEVLEKKSKMWKVYHNANANDDDDDNNNDDGQRTNIDQKISIEPSAQMC